MILEFSIGNFRSIKELQNLSFVAASIVSKDKAVDKENIFETKSGINLLKSLIIYGANGSGKSNLVRGLLNMMFFIRDSFSDETMADNFYEPYVLDKTSKKKATFYQIVFELDNKIFRYGYELKKGKVISEWLFGRANKKEVYYFTRENDEIKVNKPYFPEGIGLEKNKTKSTTLFLNVSDAFNGKISNSIKTFFKQKVVISSGLDDKEFKEVTSKRLDSDKMKKELLRFITMADLGINNIGKVLFEEKDLTDDTPEEMINDVKKNKKIEFIFSERNITDSKGKIIGTHKAPFDIFESAGTIKYLAYAGAIIDTLLDGKTLIIDEFDSRLHPLLARKIIKLFNSSLSNTRKSQLIVISHDTNLLDSSLFRRDQVYFAEKIKKTETKIYSLVNIGGIRNDASYSKDYIKGKYGAIPFIGEFKM